MTTITKVTSTGTPNPQAVAILLAAVLRWMVAGASANRNGYYAQPAQTR